eukprot:Lankesteria_metandrocarpae@DN10626_c0_g1_i1.p1
MNLDVDRNIGFTIRSAVAVASSLNEVALTELSRACALNSTVQCSPVLNTVCSSNVTTVPYNYASYQSSSGRVMDTTADGIYDLFFKLTHLLDDLSMCCFSWREAIRIAAMILLPKVVRLVTILISASRTSSCALYPRTATTTPANKFVKKDSTIEAAPTPSQLTGAAAVGRTVITGVLRQACTLCSMLTVDFSPPVRELAYEALSHILTAPYANIDEVLSIARQRPMALPTNRISDYDPNN